MRATVKALVPPLMRGSIERAPVTTLSLSDLLARTHSLNIKQICQLARFVPVIILIPESSHGQTVAPRVAGNRSANETTERTRSLDQDSEVSFGQVSVNFLEMSALRNGERVVLTTMELKLLRYLIQNKRRVVSRGELLNEVWGYDNYPLTRTVDNHILRLRQKLEQQPSRPVHIRTVHGAGYKFLP
jgi:Transcriptional regulatory protein, C terminal